MPVYFPALWPFKEAIKCHHVPHDDFSHRTTPSPSTKMFQPSPAYPASSSRLCLQPSSIPTSAAATAGPQLCFRQLVNEPVQHFGPALLNPRALKNRLGDGMMQGNLCRAAMLGERHRHQRFCRVAWAHAIVRRLDRGAFLIRKGIEVDDSLRLHDLAIDASAPIVLALGRSHAVMKNTTGRRSTLQNGVVKPFGPDQRIRR